MSPKLKIGLIQLYSVVLLTSCTTVYQVLETNSNNVKLKNNEYLYENNDLLISYNFWAEGGRISFSINNKTDAPIYIDWDKSHFIYNGISFEYWNDMEETNTISSSNQSKRSKTINTNNTLVLNTGRISEIKSTEINNRFSQSNSIKTKQKKIIQIPPKSTINVSRFSIESTPYFNCNFNLKSTSLKSPISKVFTKDESPILFRNYLTYSINHSFEQVKSIDNEFFISSISFLSKNTFLGTDSTYQDCDVFGNYMYKHHYNQPFKKSNSFYLLIK